MKFLFFRHANSLLKKAKEGDEEAVAAIFGTFACQASNIAGKILVSLLDNAPNYLSWVLYPKEKRYILGKK